MAVEISSKFRYKLDARGRSGIRNEFRRAVAMREIFDIEIFSKFRYELKDDSA
jgi:hypothetical protein